MEMLVANPSPWVYAIGLAINPRDFGAAGGLAELGRQQRYQDAQSEQTQSGNKRRNGVRVLGSHVVYEDEGDR